MNEVWFSKKKNSPAQVTRNPKKKNTHLITKAHCIIQDDSNNKLTEHLIDSYECLSLVGAKTVVCI